MKEQRNVVLVLLYLLLLYFPFVLTGDKILNRVRAVALGSTVHLSDTFCRYVRVPHTSVFEKFCKSLHVELIKRATEKKYLFYFLLYFLLYFA